MIKNLILAVCLFFVSNFLYAQTSTSGKIEFDINQAKVRKSLVAFPALQFTGNPAAVTDYASVGGELFRVILNDLQVSSFFRSVRRLLFVGSSAIIFEFLRGYSPVVLPTLVGVWSAFPH